MRQDDVQKQMQLAVSTQVNKMIATLKNLRDTPT